MHHLSCCHSTHFLLVPMSLCDRWLWLKEKKEVSNQVTPLWVDKQNTEKIRTWRGEVKLLTEIREFIQFEVDLLWFLCTHFTADMMFWDKWICSLRTWSRLQSVTYLKYIKAVKARLQGYQIQWFTGDPLRCMGSYQLSIPQKPKFKIWLFCRTLIRNGGGPWNQRLGGLWLGLLEQKGNNKKINKKQWALSVFCVALPYSQDVITD